MKKSASTKKRAGKAKAGKTGKRHLRWTSPEKQAIFEALTETCKREGWAGTPRGLALRKALDEIRHYAKMASVQEAAPADGATAQEVA